MKRLEMISKFCRAGISDNLFWLGAIEKADGVNGLNYNGQRWFVYYRENGVLSDVKECATQEEACDELYKRVMSLNNHELFSQ